MPLSFFSGMFYYHAQKSLSWTNYTQDGLSLKTAMKQWGNLKNFPFIMKPPLTQRYEVRPLMLNRVIAGFALSISISKRLAPSIGQCFDRPIAFVFLCKALLTTMYPMAWSTARNWICQSISVSLPFLNLNPCLTADHKQHKEGWMEKGEVWGADNKEDKAWREEEKEGKECRAGHWGGSMKKDKNKVNRYMVYY